jgi:hypothetical protein
VNAISAANGADLLQRVLEQSGQTSAAQAPQNTAATLQKAKVEAQMNEASVIGGGTPDTTGTLLNTYA